MTRVLRLLVAGIAGVLVLTGCSFHGAYDLPLPGKVVGSGDGYQVTADFADVVSVVPRTVVMANDVPVGQVDSVERVGWHARVTMTIRKDIVLPAKATADVRQTSLLGEKYIQLAPAHGATVARDGRLADGAHIPLKRTTRNPEVEEILGALSMLLSGGGVGQLKTITAELNKMMDGRQGDLRQALGRIDDLVDTLDGQKQDIVNAMSAINRLTATLNREKRTIGAALDSFGPALEVLNDQHRALMTMLRSLDRLGKVGGRVINETSDNIVASLRHLRPVLKRLADAGDSLPRGLMMLASFPFPKEAATLAKGDYSNALFRMDFDLNKALKGLVKGGNTGLPDVGELCQLYAGKAGSTLCSTLTDTLCNILPPNNILCGAAAAAGREQQRSGAKAHTSKGAGAGASTGPSSKSSDLSGLLGDILGTNHDDQAAQDPDQSGPLSGVLGLLGGGR